MKVTLITTPYTDALKIKKKLCSVNIIVDQTVEVGSCSFEANPNNPILLGYTEPEMAIVNALWQGEMPEIAFDKWISSVEDLVAYYKSNRSSTILFNLTEVLYYPLAIHSLCEHLGLDTTKESNQEHQKKDAQHRHNAVYELIASHVVLQCADIKSLLQQLEVCSLPLNSCIEIKKEKVFDYASILAYLNNKDQENSILLEQVHLVQESLESKLIELKNSEQQVAELTKVQALNKKLQQENKKLDSSSATQKKQFEVLLKSHNELREKFDLIVHDKSQVDDENALLLEQLHLVQETLEEKIIKAKKLAADQEKNAEAQKNQFTKTVNELTTDVQSLHKRIAKLHASLSESKAVQKKLEEKILTGERSSNAIISDLKNTVAAEKKRFNELVNKATRDDHLSSLSLAVANKKIHELSEELNCYKSNGLLSLVKPVVKINKKHQKCLDEKLEKEMVEITKSGLFDREWYLKIYPDVAEAGVNPIKHFLTSGAYEGRFPNENFNTIWYLNHYKEVSASGINPLLHFIRVGQKKHFATQPGSVTSLPAPK